MPEARHLQARSSARCVPPLEALRCTVDSATWAADWAEHHSRVADLLHAHTTEAERAGLRSQLSERDRELIDQMLERRLDS